MVHKRRATPSLESGGDHTAAVVLENGERTLGGTAFTRFGFPARGEVRVSRGGSGGSGSNGAGSGGCSGRGSLTLTQRGLESPSSCASSAAKGGKERRGRGRGGGSMYASRSFWFRVLCVTGGSFLLVMTAARRQGFFLSARRRRAAAAIAAAAVQEEEELEAEMEIEAYLQERRLRMATKLRAFETTPHTLKDLLGLDSGFSRRRGGSDDLVDVTAILVASSSLEAQLKALLGSSVQPTQVWVVMPTVGTTEYKAKVARYQKLAQFKDRLHVVESDLFSGLPSGMTARDSRGAGVGGSDSGSFFDQKSGLFQLAMQAATKFIWVVDPGVLPGSKFLYLLAHVSTIKGMAGVYGSEGALMPAAPTKTRRSAHQDKHSAPEEVEGEAPFALWDTDANSNTGTASRPPPPPAPGKETAHGAPDRTEVEPGGAAATAAALAGRGAMAVGGAAPAAGSDTGGVSAPISVPVMSPVDVLFSQWFLDKDLVRLLFREKWLAPGSGDGDSTGLALSYSIRRYAGLPSYVLPSHSDLPEYSGDTITSSSSATAGAVAKLPNKDKGGREKKRFGRKKNNGPDASSLASGAAAAATADHPDGGDGRSNPVSRRLAAVGNVLGGVVGDGDTAAAAAASPAVASSSSSSSLAQRLNAPALSAQFRELSARAGQFFWTPERCPKELLLLVVDGRRQAELLEPLYREQVEGNAAGAEVFIAVITQGPDESEQVGSPLEPFRRTARRDCTRVAEALGVNMNHDDANNDNANNNNNSDNVRSRRASQGFGVGRGNVPRWLGGGYAHDQDEQKSRRFLSPEEFCLGGAFGVFQVRAGQDYRQAPGRPLDPYLEVFHGLSEVLEATKPKIVAYIAAPTRTPDGKFKDGVPTNMNTNMNTGKSGRAGMDEMLAASTRYDPADTVVRAVEAAVRSAVDGGAGTPYHPIGVGLPPAAAGAEAAKALAYLPAGCLELWNEPTITLVLVHAGGEDGGLLSRTLRALSEAYYVGDRVELRLVLGAGDASDPTITRIVQGLEWEWGDLDVTYYSDVDGDGNRPPAGLAALEAFPDPKVHDHIVPVFSGGVPDPHFYVWLKVALMNEAYAHRPVKGLPFDPPQPNRSPGFRFGHEESSSAHSSGGGGGGEAQGEEEDEEGPGDVYPEDRGTWRRGTSAAAGDSAEMWGKFLALSVDMPQGLCPRRDGCSRVWTYGSEAWGALRERCRAGLAAEAAAGGGGRERTRGVGHGGRQGELEPSEVACAVGDVASWNGDEWGLEARRVCGAGPREDSGGGGYGVGGGKWERARVWEVYPFQQGGG